MTGSGTSASNMPNAYRDQIDKVVNRYALVSPFRQSTSAVRAEEKSIGDKEREENIKRLTEKVEIRTYRYVVDYNEKIKRMVVKVVDNETDNIIRQTPSEGQVRYFEAISNNLDILA